MTGEEPSAMDQFMTTVVAIKEKIDTLEAERDELRARMQAAALNINERSIPDDFYRRNFLFVLGEPEEPKL